MVIERVAVSNFRSFERLDFELSNFNVIVGANASGKSNLVSVFHFLRSIPALGLRDAILSSGGGALFRWSRASGEPVRFSITCSQSMVPAGAGLVRTAEAAPHVRATYEFGLRMGSKPGAAKVVEDQLRLEFLNEGGPDLGRDEKERLHPTLEFSHSGGRVEVESENSPNSPGVVGQLTPLLEALRKTPVADTSLLLGSPLMQPLFAGPFQDLLTSSIFSINPAVARGMNVDVGPPVLDMTGGNLSLVLGRILDTPEKRKRFLRLISTVLPWIADVRPVRFANNVVFKVRETPYQKEFFTADALSEGTVSTIALIVALYFQEKSFIVVEEPERNIHPLLLARLAEMMREVAQKRQLVVTTHSPIFVEYAGLESLLLLTRDRQGSSSLSRPATSDVVRAFLKEQIGLGAVFSKGLL